MSFLSFLCCICDHRDEPNDRNIIKQNKQPELQEKQKKQLKYSLSSQKNTNSRERRQELIKKSLSIKIYPACSIIQQKSLKGQSNKSLKYQNLQINNALQKVYQQHRTNQQKNEIVEISMKKSSGLIIKPQSLIREDSQKNYEDKTYQKFAEKSVKVIINDRFDNVWKQQQIDQQDFFELDQSVLEQGLPNMGNTCYLNSLIQLLFAAQRLVMIVQKISQNNTKSFHYRLCKVFRGIKQHSEYLSKKKSLRAVIGDIKRYQPSFKPHQQNDSLQCLLTVLNMLEDEDNSSSKINYFKLRYSFICQCKNNQNLIHQSLYVSSRQKCLVCKEDFGIIIHSSAIYLLVIPDQKLKEYMCISNVKGEQLIYQCKAFVSYFGDRSTGHYIAHRKRNNKTWICINDSKVNTNQNIKKINYIPKYCLYQFNKKKMHKPPYKN